MEMSALLPFLASQSGFFYLHPGEPICQGVHQVRADHRGYFPELSCPLSSNTFFPLTGARMNGNTVLVSIIKAYLYSIL